MRTPSRYPKNACIDATLLFWGKILSGRQFIWLSQRLVLLGFMKFESCYFFIRLKHAVYKPLSEETTKSTDTCTANSTGIIIFFCALFRKPELNLHFNEILYLNFHTAHPGIWNVTQSGRIQHVKF